MSHELVQKEWAVSFLPTPTGANGGPVDFNATGDKFIFTPVAPVDIYRFGFVTIEAMDPDAGGFVIALDKRITVGSDTGRTEVVTITRADADTVAAGKVVYKDVILPVAQATGDDGVSLVNVGPSGPLSLVPGDEAVIEVTNAVGAVSTGYVWIEYAQHGFNISASDVISDQV